MTVPSDSSCAETKNPTQVLNKGDMMIDIKDSKSSFR